MRNISNCLPQTLDTPHVVASVITPSTRVTCATSRICNGTTISTVPTISYRSQRAYDGKRSNLRKTCNKESKTPTDAGTLMLSAPALQAANPIKHYRTRSWYPASLPSISHKEISTETSEAQHPAGTGLKDTVPARKRSRRVRSAPWISTEHLYGNSSTISAVYPPSSPISVLQPNSSTTPTSIVLPLPSSTPLDPRSPNPSTTSVGPPTPSLCAIKALPPITTSGLSGLLTTLCAWRFRTFYADYLASPHSCIDCPAALLYPLQDAIDTVDWAHADAHLEIQCRKHELWRARGLRYLAPLVVKDRKVYKAARDAATVTGIPFRQIRKVVEAYAFWHESRGKQFGIANTANDMGRTLTPTRLAANKEWEKLARLILEDLEDLQYGYRWTGSALSDAGGEEMKTAIARCRDRYFTHLAYAEKRCCSIGVGRFARCMRMGRDVVKEKEKNLSNARRKMEWSLSQAERDSMDGEGELFYEMRQQHRREGLREAKVAEERFSID